MFFDFLIKLFEVVVWIVWCMECDDDWCLDCWIEEWLEVECVYFVE